MLEKGAMSKERLKWVLWCWNGTRAITMSCDFEFLHRYGAADVCIRAS